MLSFPDTEAKYLPQENPLKTLQGTLAFLENLACHLVCPRHEMFKSLL